MWADATAQLTAIVVVSAITQHVKRSQRGVHMAVKLSRPASCIGNTFTVSLLLFKYAEHDQRIRFQGNITFMLISIDDQMLSDVNKATPWA